MTNKNFYDELKKYDIDTYGINFIVYLPKLSREMAEKFAYASDHMEEEENRKIVQAFYDVFAQAYRLGVVKEIADSAFNF